MIPAQSTDPLSSVKAAAPWVQAVGDAAAADRMALRRRAFMGAAALAALSATPVCALGRPSVPLALAQEAPEDIDPRGWWVSEKFDGVRAWWDGRTLRFRSGLPCFAPRGFLQSLPPFALDGELWLGRGRFEELSGIVRRTQPDETAWRDVRYMVFELPGAAGRFEDRARILRERLPPADDVLAENGWPGNARSASSSPERAVAVTQTVFADRTSLHAALRRVVDAGGEGLMLHRADAPEIHGRSQLLLKLKPVHDDEATVVGYQPGRGQLSGRMGALRVRDDAGRLFELGTGFTEEQRANPPALGARVTFTHRGRTSSGMPRFASFLRLQPA